jgi:hypothetical protein
MDTTNINYVWMAWAVGAGKLELLFGRRQGLHSLVFRLNLHKAASIVYMYSSIHQDEQGFYLVSSRSRANGVVAGSGISIGRQQALASQRPLQPPP